MLSAASGFPTRFGQGSRLSPRGTRKLAMVYTKHHMRDAPHSNGKHALGRETLGGAVATTGDKKTYYRRGTVGER